MTTSSPTKTLSLGKLRGLQQIASSHGFFTMTAMDHRASMQRMIDPYTPESVSAETLTAYKRDLTATLAPVSSAVLLDPIYGAAQVVASGDLPRDVGLLVGVEASGYTDQGGARLTEFLEGWSVEKIKRMGASAAKILIYYHPDLNDISERQRAVTSRFIEDCQRNDLPALVEPVAYPAMEGDLDPEVFARRKPDLVVRTARELTSLGVDVLKAEFPTHPGFERDEVRMLEACQALDAASSAPWILLSGGVSFKEFATQVRIACRAGASGFLAGRAVWQEAMQLESALERKHWLESVATARVRQLSDIVGEFGKPWWKKWAATQQELTATNEGWYKTY